MKKLASLYLYFSAWGRGAAGTFLVGFVLIVICFALSIIAFAIPTLRFNFIRGIGGLCFLSGKTMVHSF